MENRNVGGARSPELNIDVKEVLNAWVTDVERRVWGGRRPDGREQETREAQGLRRIGLGAGDPITEVGGGRRPESHKGAPEKHRGREE